TTEQTIAAALNTTGFLNLDRATQKTLLFDLLGISFTRDDIGARIAQLVGQKHATAASARVSKLPAEIDYGPDMLAFLEEQAVTERRTLKRRLKELEAHAKTPVAVTLPDGVTLEDRDAVKSQLESL